MPLNFNLKVDNMFLFQELAMQILAERFAENLEEHNFERVNDWVQGITPGVFDEVHSKVYSFNA